MKRWLFILITFLALATSLVVSIDLIKNYLIIPLKFNVHLNVESIFRVLIAIIVPAYLISSLLIVKKSDEFFAEKTNLILFVINLLILIVSLFLNWFIWIKELFFPNINVAG